MVRIVAQQRGARLQWADTVEKVRFLQTLIFFHGRRGRHRILSWGARQFRVQAACGPCNGSETASSGNIRSNRGLADFRQARIFDFFNTIGRMRTPLYLTPANTRSFFEPACHGKRSISVADEIDAAAVFEAFWFGAIGSRNIELAPEIGITHV